MAIKLSSMFALVLLLLFTVNAYSENVVSIEFFYWDPSDLWSLCPTCEGWNKVIEKYNEASSLLDDIQREYGTQVSIERVDKTTTEGIERCNQYSCVGSQVVVINRTIKLEGEQLTRENLKKYIDMYLRGENPSADLFQPISALVAFSLGLLSGVSPCLMAMLAFILSYTSGTVSNSKSGILRVLVFGIGFISAIMLLGTLIATTLMSIPSLYIAMMWAVSILIILVGLNLMGLLNVPFGSKPFVQKLARKYSATTIGLYSLGFIFYFVNLCTAPLSFTVLPTLTTPKNMYLLALFGLGALVPFLAVGIIAGGSPTLAKRIREQHRYKIRAFSGAILLTYSTWLIVFNLMPSRVFLIFSNEFLPFFSTSLVAMLAFILAFSASSCADFKGGLGRSFFFALGLVTGVFLVAIVLMVAGVSFYLFLFAHLQTVTMMTAAMMIVIGLLLIEVEHLPISSRAFIQRLTDRYSFTILGLFFLGFLFFFATFRTFPLARFITGTVGTSIDFNLLMSFSLVLLVPFLVVGVVSGVVPKLERDIRDIWEKYRLEIRALSGAILIAYALWLLLSTIML